MVKNTPSNGGGKWIEDNPVLRVIGGATSEETQEVLELSEEAQEAQKRFDTWLKKNENYAKEHNIQKNVKITNNGIELWENILRWSGHQFWGVNVQSDEDLEKQPYTIEQMWAMIQVLWGKELKLDVRSNFWWSEISSFLLEVANIKLDWFYCSSSSFGINNYHVRGLKVALSGVSVKWDQRNSGYLSSFSL